MILYFLYFPTFLESFSLEMKFQDQTKL